MQCQLAASVPVLPQYYARQTWLFPLQALGFHIWVAELELLLGQVKGSKANIDPVAGLQHHHACTLRTTLKALHAVSIFQCI